MANDGSPICGIGMVTAVGDCSAQTATSVRAGISRYQESSVYNRRFQPMTMALLPDEVLAPLNEELAALPDLSSRQSRMLRLADPALREALQALPPDKAAPLFLAGPEPLPDHPPAITDGFLDHLLTQTGGHIDRDGSRLFPTGRAAAMEALQAAMASLEGGQEYALVGGVDSYLDLYLLGTLDLEDRVLADGVMDGFAPGEGAAFLLLCSADARSSHPEATILVHTPGIASEPGHRYSEEPYRGDGLAQAIALAVQSNGSAPIPTVLASLNGENFGAKEWGVATIRNHPSLDPQHRIEHPADCFGDTGAAVGPILMGLAALGMQKGYLPGPCLVWCASDGELRGATRVTMESN